MRVPAARQEILNALRGRVQEPPVQLDETPNLDLFDPHSELSYQKEKLNDLNEFLRRGQLWNGEQAGNLPSKFGHVPHAEQMGAMEMDHSYFQDLKPAEPEDQAQIRRLEPYGKDHNRKSFDGIVDALKGDAR